jgi:single-strand DNA-binding protein
MNNVQLQGLMGKDAVITTYESGKKKVSFSLATTEKYTNYKGESLSNTTWHNIVAWGAQAEKYANLVKGTKLYIQGSISNRSYQDKEGNTKYISEIVANDMQKIENTEVASMTES